MFYSLNCFPINMTMDIFGEHVLHKGMFCYNCVMFKIHKKNHYIFHNRNIPNPEMAFKNLQF